MQNKEKAKKLVEYLCTIGFDAFRPGGYYDISKQIEKAIADWFEQQEKEKEGDES